MQLFELPDGKAVCFNPGGHFHGWLFYRHADGQLVSQCQLRETKAYPDDHPLAKLFGQPQKENHNADENSPTDYAQGNATDERREP